MAYLPISIGIYANSYYICHKFHKMKTEIVSVQLTNKGNSEFRIITPIGERLIIGFMSFIPASTEIVELYKNIICRITDAYYMSDENKRVTYNSFLERNLYKNGYGMHNYIIVDIDTTRTRIGKRIKELRELKKMDAKTLSKATGIDPANICRIEQGQYSVGLDTLSKIANALGYKVDLVPDDGEDQMKENMKIIKF